MAKKSTIRTNWPKYVLQWGVLVLLVFFLSGAGARLFPGSEPANPERFCPFGGLEALATYIQRGSLPCSMTSMQIVIGVALAALVILFSKLFCAFICPLGSIEDLLKKLRGAIGFKGISIRNGSAVDSILRIVKYGLLFWVFYMTISSSELFCKNLDPYYAMATGFKGEITLWMSLVTVGIVILPGLVIDRFWCRYICPLGAISNSLKFWAWMAGMAVVFMVLGKLGVTVGWVWILAAFCLLGYLLEIICRKPKMQILHVVRDEDKCGRTCRSCRKACPYNIDATLFNGSITSVDCTLCGECVASCPGKALSIGTGRKESCKAARFLPAIITVVVAVPALIFGGKFEIPTISETWDVEEGMKLETVRLENLRSVKCYSSSMAFKARLEHIKGVHGVKTYVGSHSVVISYDPAKVTPEKIRSEIFVPSHFRVVSPDPTEYPEIKVVTIRTENMTDKVDLNYLGLQFRMTEKKIFGVTSEYDCPLIVRVYMAPEEELDEEFYRSVVEKKSLDMPVHGGGVKSTPVDYEFVKLEPGFTAMPVKDYLYMMFDGFHNDYNGRYPSGDTTIVRKRFEEYSGQPQFIYEIADQSYEKPIFKRVIPYLSNHMSREEGMISMDLTLNKDLVPCFQFRFASPMTEARVWELLNEDPWTITYKENEDVRQEPARIKFDEPGICFPAE